jgi:alanine racemase
MGLDPIARINLSALRHNLRKAREAVPDSRILAVIKADGYGHGMLRVARALSEADALAVARVSEGVRLRQSGEQRRIVVLGGCLEKEELQAAAQHALDPVVHEPGQLELLEQQKLLRQVHCWLKVNTGMHRLGFSADSFPAVLQRLQDCLAVAPDIRVMTHLACADVPSDPLNDLQLSRFGAITAGLELEFSIANSAGLLGWREAHADWVRPGIMLYGASPFEGRSAGDDGLRPVMTLESRLIAVNRCEKGGRIGYGGTWTCPEEMPVGVIAIGYGDGYPRHAPSGTPVLLNGRRLPLIGRVSMDSITVDLRSQPGAGVGDKAVLWGEGLPAEEIALAAGTIPYELFCNVGSRVKFEETDEEKAVREKP